MPAILVRSHGPVTWGADGRAAVHNSVVLERVAEMAFYTMRLNPDATPIAEHLQRYHFGRKHGDAAYYGQVVPRKDGAKQR